MLLSLPFRENSEENDDKRKKIEMFLIVVGFNVSKQKSRIGIVCPFLKPFQTVRHKMQHLEKANAVYAYLLMRF